MKLSILIPTYDYVCYTLVHDLHTQCEAMGDFGGYEIIVMEDGGKDQVKAIANHKINDLPHCRYIRKKENVGRAYNINNLTKESIGEWCLIIDCDAKITTPHFINNYLLSIKQQNADVIVGGLINPTSLPSPDVTLRYYYEKKAEPYRTTEYCNAHPYNRFSTFNVLIKRTVLVETPFHPTFTKYGFEDTFMGVELGKKKAKVVYINNPLMHMGFDSNDVFLKKTETSLAMLSSAGEMLLPYTRIGQVINKCEKWHVTNVINIFFKITKPLLRKNLLGNSPNMNIFAFYKLGYYIGIAK